MYPITPSLGLTEDQDLAAIHFLLQELDQTGVLIAFLHKQELLRYPVVGFELCGTDDYPVGVPQKL